MRVPLLTPDLANLKKTNHGLWVDELVNGNDDGNMPGAPFSVAYLVVPPGESLGTHRHDSSWAYILLWDAGEDGAITQYGEEMGEMVVHHPGQIVVVPPGLPHRGRNTSKTDTVIGYEFRSCGSIFDDRILLPHLDHVAVLQPSPQRRRTVMGLAARSAGTTP
jgi:uncharacterized RmlC-like cupin family protein